jgi:hypothetical protein
MLNSRALCQCLHAAGPCCMNMLHEQLHEHAVWICCVNMNMNRNKKMKINIKDTCSCPCCFMLNVHFTWKFWCYCCMSVLHFMSPLHARAMSVLLVYHASPFCMSILHANVHISCLCSMSMSPCCLSMLLIQGAYLSCMSLLHVHAACPCLYPFIHAACPCCTNILYEYAEWTYCRNMYVDNDMDIVFIFYNVLK